MDYNHIGNYQKYLKKLKHQKLYFSNELKGPFSMIFLIEDDPKSMELFKIYRQSMDQE